MSLIWIQTFSGSYHFAACADNSASFPIKENLAVHRLETLKVFLPP